ncbi:MAG: STM4015 family protein [Defluviitaleaceae bacterium]|nr:STM4015 family protein [Defluviitaleaceae bacterium]
MEKTYYCTWGDGTTVTKLAEEILNDPELPNVKSIVIGMWNHEIGDTPPDEILEMMVANKEKFQHVESLYVGAMSFEENEISWIVQGDYEDLLNALPNLKSLKIKGSNELDLGKIDHKNLEKLQIKTGGLPEYVMSSLKSANLPNLKKLILYLGVEDYGYDCKLLDFEALASKSLFPNLNVLGFVNGEEQDELVRIILESDLLPQLKTIRVSCGCLTDKGGQLILDAAAAGKLDNLQKLNAKYHYMSDEMMEKLKALPFKVKVGDQQEREEGDDDDDDYTGMWPMITE